MKIDFYNYQNFSAPKSCYADNKGINFGDKSRIAAKYSREFLKSIRDYGGLTCPICGKNLISMDVFYMRSEFSLRYLEPFTSQMTPTNRRVFYRLKAESNKYPQKTVNELLTQMEPASERANDIKRVQMLRDFLEYSGRLSGRNKKVLVEIFNRFNNMIRDNTPEKIKFTSLFDGEIMNFLKDVENEAHKENLERIWRQLPRACNDENAMIVELARNQKANAAVALYEDPFGVMGHIIPHSKGGDIVVWECMRDDKLIKNFPLHLLVKELPDIPDNMKKHVARLIQIYKKTLGKNTERFSNLLRDYILDVCRDIKKASKDTIIPDVSELLK